MFSIFEINLVLRFCLLLLFCFFKLLSFSQTLGGNSAYNFLKLSSSAMLTGVGGTNISYRPSEVSISANNPALLSPVLRSQFNTSFNSFLGGTKAYSLTGAIYKENINTTFGGHVYFIDYGKIPSTDASGNSTGEFRPVDFVLQLSAARRYLEKWTYGGSLKLIHSSYSLYNSSAIAFDFGLLYVDSAQKLNLAVVAKNMGFQLKTYNGENEDLPFDLQIGITKRLSKAPFGFSLTAHHLHRFNLNYNDERFDSENGFEQKARIHNLFNHFVVATHVYIGSNVETSIGYDHLRRQELSIQDGSNGLTGFSTGLRISFNRLQILYARSSYQKGISYNQIGITFKVNKN